MLVTAITKIVLVSALTTGFAVAGGWEQSVDLAASAEHDSNPAMSATSDGSVWRGRLVPRYSLAGSFGRNEFAATLGLLAEQSSDERLSSRRQDKSGSLSWGHAFDTGSLRISARADEASTRATEFEDSGLVSRESTRHNYSANLNGHKGLSATTSLTVGASHAESKYDDTALINYLNQTAEFGFGFAVSEYFGTTARLAASEYNPDGPGVPSKTYSISFGVSAQSGERFSWAAQCGFRHTVSDIESDGSDGLLSLQWNGATDDFLFAVSRQYSPSSIGSMNVVDSIKGHWQHQWGPKSSLSADLSLTKRLGVLETGMTQITAAFIYDTSAVSNVRVYVHEKRLNQANSTVTATVIGASLAYNWRP